MKKKMKAITTAYSILFQEIENSEDLRKHKLTLADYHTACDIMQELRMPGSMACTICEHTARFFEKCGYTVTEKGIGYCISI